MCRFYLAFYPRYPSRLLSNTLVLVSFWSPLVSHWKHDLLWKNKDNLEVTKNAFILPIKLGIYAVNGGIGLNCWSATLSRNSFGLASTVEIDRELLVSPIFIAILARAYQLLLLITVSRSLHEFTFVHHTRYLTLTRFVAIRRITHLAAFVQRKKNSLCYVVRAASLFKLLGSPYSKDGSFVYEQLLLSASNRTQ